MLSWWQRWREARQLRQLRQHAIPDALWHEVLAAYPFIQARPEPVRQQLRTLSSLFLARKEFHTVGGLALSDFMACSIAAQACLPILALGLHLYDHQVGIVLHPDAVWAPRQEIDAHGVVHEWQEELAGEAMAGGPLMLACSAVAAEDDPEQPVFNVVIHEFVHLLDLGNGQSDGLPWIEDPSLRQRWVRELPLAWDRLADRVAHREPSCLDPYGCEALDEFLAVAAEAFFVDALTLRSEDPALYRLLSDYFRQDPAAERQPT